MKPTKRFSMMTAPTLLSLTLVTGYTLLSRSNRTSQSECFIVNNTQYPSKMLNFYLLLDS
ncbi:hypothetical protein OESDEN_15528, partial [Oesophagostomum dentatum]